MDTLNSFSALLQALTGVIALIISIVALVQNKKIKELSDIATEMKNQTDQLVKQNEILIGQYILEKKMTLKQRIAFFQKYSSWTRYGDSGVVIEVQNIGITATDFRIEYNRKPDITIKVNESVIAGNDTTHLFILYPNGDLHSPFDFDISYSNPERERARQKIYSIGPNDYAVDPPTEYLS